MKRTLSYLSLLPLPLLAGVFLASQRVEPVDAGVAVHAAAPVPYVSQFPAPQTDPKEVPAEPAPTF
jgi:hypothetical protein